MAKIGAGLLGLFVLFMIFAPFLAPHHPTEQDLSKALLPPFQTMAHPLGTDQLGRDILSRILYGARVSILVGLSSIGIATVFGTTVGLIAGFSGGRIDDILMRATDVIITIPSIMVAVTVFGIIGPLPLAITDPFVTMGLISSEMPETFVLPGAVIFALAFVGWTTFARVARSEALSVKTENYVMASKSLGAANPHILLKHIFPNSFSPILVLATLRIGFAILTESALAFLGFSGAQVSWGRDIATGRDYLASSWWVAILPGVAIILIVIAVNLIGDMLRDAFDPNLDDGSGGDG